MDLRTGFLCSATSSTEILIHDHWTVSLFFGVDGISSVTFISLGRLNFLVLLLGARVYS